SFNRDDAAEALQEGLVSAYGKAHTFRHECPVRGWLYRIVVNACLDKMRAQRIRTHTELTPALTNACHYGTISTRTPPTRSSSPTPSPSSPWSNGTPSW